MTTQLPTPPSEAVRERVRAEQVDLIYRQAPPAGFIGLVIAGLLSLALRDVTPHGPLWVFIGIIGVLSVVRRVLVVTYRRRDTTAPVRLWEYLFTVTLALTALVWGVGGLLLMPPSSPAHQAVVYFFLMGMAGGAVATYSAHWPCVTLSIVGLMLPSTVYFAWQWEPVRGAMALGGLIYAAAAFRATHLLDFFLRRSFQLSLQLEHARTVAEALARTDELTGLHNRRAFRELAEVEMLRAKRSGKHTSVLMLDLDHLKKVNDTHGHGGGDAALRMTADVLRRVGRATDIVGRWGGEEFVLLLPDTTLEQAALSAERLRHALARTPVEHQGKRFEVTCSLGVASRRGEASLDALLAGADGALYRAKREGRNRVATDESDAEPAARPVPAASSG